MFSMIPACNLQFGCTTISTRLRVCFFLIFFFCAFGNDKRVSHSYIALLECLLRFPINNRCCGEAVGANFFILDLCMLSPSGIVFELSGSSWLLLRISDCFITSLASRMYKNPSEVDSTFAKKTSACSSTLVSCNLRKCLIKLWLQMKHVLAPLILRGNTACAAIRLCYNF